ncbi:MAG: beta-ketoacyl synthase N-terminal-like domain-containing protein [Isosphaeraceae bacterium]
MLQQDPGPVAVRERPFDAGCDGTILGEGIGLVVLKRLDDARRDGDRVYAVIRSVGTSSDGKGNAVYAPSAGQAQAACGRRTAGRGSTRPRSNSSGTVHRHEGG